MKRSEPTLDDQIRSIHYKYEIPQDKAEALLSSGLRFLEIDKAALLSILAEVPIDTILDMRKDDPWGCIQKKLGLTAALYEERLLRHRARRLHRFYGITVEAIDDFKSGKLDEIYVVYTKIQNALTRLKIGRASCRERV